MHGQNASYNDVLNPSNQRRRHLPTGTGHHRSFHDQHTATSEDEQTNPPNQLFDAVGSAFLPHNCLIAPPMPGPATAVFMRPRNATAVRPATPARTGN